ncbi:laccase, multicopper oxidase, benzenediol:oxygen oxidorectuctase [Marasmius tenuissimus]|nr:laccase, multicopper oxidase, benzenediol:oxygen oxidorectuctase [Marasmius tenuissimus]
MQDTRTFVYLTTSPLSARRVAILSHAQTGIRRKYKICKVVADLPYPPQDNSSLRELFRSLHVARLQSLLSFVLLAILGANGAHIGPAADLVISNGVVSPDGFSRSAVLAGGTTIGPVIIGNKGESLKVNVVNQLNDPTMLQSTSIHWHGFFQEHTNWNQCPIPKGTSFLYDFPIREQAGTFWYHSHLSTQYCDGLRGVVVVYDPQDPHAHLYDVDDDSTVITLADWYHTKAKTLVDPTPDTTLINGLGRHKGGAPTDLAIIQVQQGKRRAIPLFLCVK